MKDIPLGIYRHYKGHDYQVIGFALQTETREKLVLYKALYDTPELLTEYGKEPIFARPHNEFIKMIQKEGKFVPRFKLIKDES